MNDSSISLSLALPTALPEDVGLSPAGLARLEAVMQREVNAKRFPASPMLIARGGKVAYRGCVGALAARAGRRCAATAFSASIR